jgi:hypothetical protein
MDHGRIHGFRTNIFNTQLPHCFGVNQEVFNGLKQWDFDTQFFNSPRNSNSGCGMVLGTTNLSNMELFQ